MTAHVAQPSLTSLGRPNLLSGPAILPFGNEVVDDQMTEQAAGPTRGSGGGWVGGGGYGGGWDNYIKLKSQKQPDGWGSPWRYNVRLSFNNGPLCERAKPKAGEMDWGVSTYIQPMQKPCLAPATSCDRSTLTRQQPQPCLKLRLAPGLNLVKRRCTSNVISTTLVAVDQISQVLS